MVVRVLAGWTVVIMSVAAVGTAQGSFAVAVVDHDPGQAHYLKAPIDRLLGAPDAGLNWEDVQGSVGHFGQVTVDMGVGGVQDVPGIDIRFWFGGFHSQQIEVIEGFTVEISEDLVTFLPVGDFPREPTISGPIPLFSRDLDIAATGLAGARYLRITDTGTDEPFRGLELNAIEGLPESSVPGDADGDGDVDLDDFSRLKQGFGLGISRYQGDFDADQDVDLDDFVILKQHFGLSVVPEPTTLSLLLLAGALAVKRRRS